MIVKLVLLSVGGYKLSISAVTNGVHVVHIAFPYRARFAQDRPNYCIGFKGDRCAVKRGGIYN